MPLSSAALCQIKHKARSRVFLRGLGADECLLLSAAVSAGRTASLELLLDSQIGSQTPGMEQQHGLGAASLNSAHYPMELILFGKATGTANTGNGQQ